MIIEELKIKASGYVRCKSSFYSALDVLNGNEFCFSPGINRIRGEIDSGVFGISYLLSMPEGANKKMLLSCEASINGVAVELPKITGIACYMDKLHPMFSTSATIRALIRKGLKKSNAPFSESEIIDRFMLRSDVVDRTIAQSGNESVKAMAAVAYSFGVEVFCFPWLSSLRFEAFGKHLDFTLEILDSLGKTVILPLSPSV